jgi:peptidoglycan/LPS O-acetylase OafA/YrhL
VPSSSDVPPVDRVAVRRGGLVGVALGVALLGLCVFFLVRGPEEPSEELGVFLPLAVALVCLGLGAMALLPLRYGDPRVPGSRSPSAIATTFRALGGLGVLLTAAGLVRSELPWTAFGLLPLLASVGLVKDSGRVS